MARSHSGGSIDLTLEDETRCPVCDEKLPVSEMQAHCNNHFEDGSVSGGQPSKSEEFRRNSDPNDLKEALKRPMSEDFITLLERCLKRSDNSVAALSGVVDLYQSEPGDAGWGCGYRNIQMLASHLLKRSKDMKEALFQGCGFVPDIASLQFLVELAWQGGWDRAGSEQLGGKLQGTRTWIGTTECAALLRSCGIRAEIVDFEGGKGQDAARDGCSSQGRSGSVADEMHPSVQCDGCNQYPIKGACYTSETRQDYDLCASCHGKPSAQPFAPYSRRQGRKQGTVDNGPALMRWVWKYFTGEELHQSRRIVSDGRCSVLRSELCPLYLQHEGHSRTIVGMEIKRDPGRQECSLLMLDPNERVDTLQSALQSGRGWQRLVKRGLHTLRKAEYQILYVEDNMLAEDELEDSKVIRAAARF